MSEVCSAERETGLMVYRNKLASGALAFVAVTFASAMLAADTSGRIMGTVTDPSGNPISGSAATLTNKATGVKQTTQAGNQGAFAFPVVPAGVYELVIRIKNFRPYKKSDTAVDPGSAVQLQVRLEPAGVNESVNVTEDATQAETLDARQAADPPETAGDSRWSLHFQTTSIGQHHWGFPALYSGVNSLSDRPESRVSLTGTVYLGLRLTKSTELVVDPEIAGGEGFSGVTGIAGFTNGEMPRVTTATPKLYPARMYLRQTWNLGGGTEAVADGANQTAGKEPARRISWTVGKFALTDFFDNNSYSDDPRTQFMNWAIMYNGAWDYAADTRGYTWGSVEEFASPHYSFRVASAMMPTAANGPHFDLHLGANRSEVAEWETDYSPGGKKGALRILGYANRSDAGTYREALQLDGGGAPELGPTRRDGTLKYGFGANIEQALTNDVGVFARYGWNDGKTESFAFTEIDRTVSGGAVAAGRRWGRPADRVGIAAVQNFLSGDHRSFLAAGGTGFIIGDGRLNYAPESIVEAYYAFYAGAGFTTTLDYQQVWNPAYNQDRGPAPVLSLRLHWER